MEAVNQRTLEKQRHARSEDADEEEKEEPLGTTRESRGEYEEENECPDCDTSNLKHDYQRGELVCDDCGLVVVKNFVDTGPEWRSFSMEEWKGRARTGAPMNVMQHDKGLSSIIGNDRTDLNGGHLSSKKRLRFNRLRGWHRKTRRSSAIERNLAIALGEIDRMASQLDIPTPVKEDASMLYREAAKKELVRGRSIEGISGSTLYIAARQHGVPRTLDEVVSVARISKKKLARAHRYVVDELDVKLPPTKPVEYVPRFCSKLGLSQFVVNEAEKMLKAVETAPFTYGKAPSSITAAAIYGAASKCGEHVTQEDVAYAAGTTEVTIRNRFKDMVEVLDEAGEGL